MRFRIFEVKKNAILNAIFINVLVVCFFCIFYRTQIFVDDLVQTVDVNGLYTNISDYHLQWGGIALGKVLQFFYNVFPQYNWYAINQFATSFIALTLFSYLLLQKQWGNVEKYVVFIILFTCGFELYVAMCFTKTAGIIAAIAIYISVSEDASKLLKVIGGGLFWWATQIRFDFFLMIVCGVIIVLIVKIIYNYKNKPYVVNSLKRVALFSLFFLLIFAERHIESMVKNQNSMWEEYYQRNSYRSAVYDRGEIYANFDEYEEEYISLGITKSMAELWNTNNPDFRYPDSDIYMEALDVGEKLNYENRNISKYLDIHKINTFFKTDILRNIKTDLWFVYFMIALVVILFLGANKKIIGAFSVSMILFLAFEYYLYVNGRYARHRVDVAVAAFMIIFFLLLIDKISVTARKVKTGGILLSTFLLFVLLVYNNYVDDYYAGTEGMQAQIEANQLFYQQTNSDMSNVYFQVITNSAAGGQGFYDSFIVKHAFDKMEPGYLKNITFAYSTPIKDEVMRTEYGITDVWMDVIDNENMYIVIPNDQYGNSMVPLVSNYLSDRRKKTVHLAQVKYYSDKNVYRAYTDSYHLSKVVEETMEEDKYTEYKLESNSSFDADGVSLSCGVNDSVIELSGTVRVDSDDAFQNKAYLCVRDNDTGKKKYYYILQNFGDAAIDESYTISLSQKLPEYYSDDDKLTLILAKGGRDS